MEQPKKTEVLFLAERAKDRSLLSTSILQPMWEKTEELKGKGMLTPG